MSSSSPPEPPEIGAPAGPGPDDRDTTTFPFLVVGIGGSAGGLEAFLDMLGALPVDPGVCFLFVLHLEAHRKSHLAEVVAQATRLPVLEATDQVAVQVNHIYIIPPDAQMALTDGHLSLAPRPPARIQNMPVDHLFRSLATVQKSRSIGVILSGGGTDGTLGLQAIKAEGGITFVQDDKSARHGSMPRSALSDGNVDYVLPPRDIAQQLCRLAQHPYHRADTAAQEIAEAIGDVLAHVRSATGVDFSHYKRTTVDRRIQRRMALRSLDTVAEYLHLLRQDPAESEGLYHDLLIRVTRFFRDPEAYDALAENVFPRLVQGRPLNTPIRIWSAGCATGEEPYSVAMCLLEYLGSHSISFPIKILATDLNESALEKARAGIYVDNIELDVPAERLRRFFIRSDGHYQISKSVRDLCVFSRHNLAVDPPFSRLDLVVCRNLLIYVDRALQGRILSVLHYALNPDGFLFLGSSESLGGFADIFEVVDPKNRIFSKRPVANAMAIEFGTFPTGGGIGHVPERPEGAVMWTALDVQREADRLLVSRYAPVGVVVDELGTVVQFRGRTSAYLEPAPGQPSLDLLRMLREGLMTDVRAALNQAKLENAPVVRSSARITEGTVVRQIKVEVVPFKLSPFGARFFLVLFQDLPVAAAAPAGAPLTPPDHAGEQQIAQLQQELGAVREYLQSVIEEQESTNEELKSANEEILSANEELQSTNEELQTAKEEAQSANEELVTLNDELQHRNSELGRVNNDLVNLLGGINIPIVMVSRDLRIRRFTSSAEKVFNLIATDVGRPISNLKPELEIPDLAGLIARVIDTLSPYTAEVRDRHGHAFSLRIRPYVTMENKIDGASIVLVDDLDTMQKSAGSPA